LIIYLKINLQDATLGSTNRQTNFFKSATLIKFKSHSLEEQALNEKKFRVHMQELLFVVPI